MRIVITGNGSSELVKRLAEQLKCKKYDAEAEIDYEDKELFKLFADKKAATVYRQIDYERGCNGKDALFVEGIPGLLRKLYNGSRIPPVFIYPIKKADNYDHIFCLEDETFEAYKKYDFNPIKVQGDPLKYIVGVITSK